MLQVTFDPIKKSLRCCGHSTLERVTICRKANFISLLLSVAKLQPEEGTCGFLRSKRKFFKFFKRLFLFFLIIAAFTPERRRRRTEEVAEEEEQSTKSNCEDVSELPFCMQQH